MKKLYKIENENLKKENKELKKEIESIEERYKYLESRSMYKIKTLESKYKYEIKMIEETYENKLILKSNTEKVIESIENRIINNCKGTTFDCDVDLIKAYTELIREVNKCVKK